MSKSYLPPIFQTGKLLVVGMGGGCDVITAYVVSQCLPGLSKNVAWGNTKRTSDGTVDLNPPHQYFRHVPTHVPLEAGKDYYGTVGIDASVPQGPHDSPLITVLPRPKTRNDRVPEEILQEMGKDMATLGFDGVVAVDAGGDSLTGGIDHNGDPSTGTDQMMARVVKYSGLPCIMVVCGLGSDGESAMETITSHIEQETTAGTLIGVESMLTWAPLFRQMSVGLEDYRTPCLMAEACE
eukprot:PhF_6_TR33582/c0_g1_i2/m.49010